MAHIKWIKISTDMFSNKKILAIRKLPEGNNIILIWVMILTRAGESNNNGGLFLTEALPYTVEDLAEEFRFDYKVMQLALSVLDRYGMIETYDDILYIKNWDEYQNVDGMQKIREQTRARVEKFREVKKILQIEELGTEPKKTRTKKESKAKTTYDPGSDEYYEAMLLSNLIYENNNKFKELSEAQLQSWCKDFNIMLRIDKRSHEDIVKVIKFSQADGFWKSNILSPSKLRKQFDQLYMKMNNKPQMKGQVTVESFPGIKFMKA